MTWYPINPFPQNYLLTEAGTTLLTEDDEVILVEQDLTPAWVPVNDAQ